MTKKLSQAEKKRRKEKRKRQKEEYKASMKFRDMLCKIMPGVEGWAGISD